MRWIALAPRHARASRAAALAGGRQGDPVQIPATQPTTRAARSRSTAASTSRPSGCPCPGVIINHGFLGNWKDSGSVARELASHGYVVLRYSSRGFGKTPGEVDLMGPKETQDLLDAVHWLNNPRARRRRHGPAQPHRPVRRQLRRRPRVGARALRRPGRADRHPDRDLDRRLRRAASRTTSSCWPTSTASTPPGFEPVAQGTERRAVDDEQLLAEHAPLDRGGERGRRPRRPARGRRRRSVAGQYGEGQDPRLHRPGPERRPVQREPGDRRLQGAARAVPRASTSAASATRRRSRASTRPRPSTSARRRSPGSTAG